VKHIVLPRRSQGASVTAVIPCYNYGHYLEAAVSSVLEQPDVDARVIIVDDASPDGSGDVALRLAAHDPRVRALVHEENRGHIRTYNDGLRLVETEYAALISADDLIGRGSLSRAVSLMELHPRVGMVYGRIATFDKDTDRLPRRHRPYHLWRIWGGDEWTEGVVRSGYNPIASPEAVVRTAAMEQIGYYNAALPHTGDLEYWLRIAARWDIGQIHGPIQAYYRVHGGNMHITDFGTRETDLRERYAAFRVLEDPSVVEDAERAEQRLQQARQALSAQATELIAEEHRLENSTGSLSEFLHELTAAYRQTAVLDTVFPKNGESSR
jgi:glycosyltransferase involved in cell wall biosynthesis